MPSLSLCEHRQQVSAVISLCCTSLQSWLPPGPWWWLRNIHPSPCQADQFCPAEPSVSGCWCPWWAGAAVSPPPPSSWPSQPHTHNLGMEKGVKGSPGLLRDISTEGIKWWKGFHMEPLLCSSTEKCTDSLCKTVTNSYDLTETNSMGLTVTNIKILPLLYQSSPTTKTTPCGLVNIHRVLKSWSGALEVTPNSFFAFN